MTCKTKVTLAKAVISPEKGQFEQLGETLEERLAAFKQVIRKAAQEVEKEGELRWTAGIHLNTEIPHAHLAIRRDRAKHLPHHVQSNQRGIALVEAIIGLFILTIILLSGAQLFRVHVEHLALVERARRADEQAHITMNTLAAYNFSALPDGNPFQSTGNLDTFAEGEPVQLDGNVCIAQANCDRIVRVPHTSDTGSDFVTIGWNQTPPTNSSVVYNRAWRVTTLDPLKRLRRITLAILPVEPNQDLNSPIEPLAMRQTDVVQRQ